MSLQAVATAVTSLSAAFPTAVTFLPPGRGALILVVGGLLSLGLSMVWSIVAFHPARAFTVVTGGEEGSRPTGAYGGAATFRRPPSRAGGDAPPPLPQGSSRPTHWLEAVLEQADRQGFGSAEILAMEPRRWAVQLWRCRSCAGGAAPPGGCAPERKFLQDAAHGAGVVEVACNPGGSGACTFELRAGESA